MRNCVTNSDVPVVAVVMGVISSAFGGIIRDVVSDEVPLFLRWEVYVTVALAVSVVFVAMVAGFGLDIRTAGAREFIFCFAVRGFALQFGWSLPTYKSQPGRTQEELEELGVLSKDNEG